MMEPVLGMLVRYTDTPVQGTTMRSFLRRLDAAIGWKLSGIRWGSAPFLATAIDNAVLGSGLRPPQGGPRKALRALLRTNSTVSADEAAIASI